MSDPRVNAQAIAARYGLDGSKCWNITPMASLLQTKGKRVISLAGDAGAAERVIRGVIRLFEATTMAEHREAVELFEHDLLWDGPPILLSNKGHLRLATYLFKYFAHVRLHPVTAIVSEPAPGLHLIELDMVAVSTPHRPLWLPLTRLLPQQVPKNVHIKLGVNGSLETGKVELLTGRLTNLPPFLLFAWMRAAAGVAMGALPHALEYPLGFVFDALDGDAYYAEKRHAAFAARHPASANPTLDWLRDAASDVPAWAMAQGSVALESLQAVTGTSFQSVHTLATTIINFYAWLFTTLWGFISNASGSLTDGAQRVGAALPASFQPGTAGATGFSHGSAGAAAGSVGGGGRVVPGTTTATATATATGYKGSPQGTAPTVRMAAVPPRPAVGSA